MDDPKPSLTVDAVVLSGRGDDTALLVIRRDRDPFAGHLALPGGFVDPYEIPYQAVLRELAEETALEPLAHHMAALSLRTKKGRDPRGWTLSQPYLIHLDEQPPVSAGDDAREAFWMPLKDLDRLAFDHGAILCEALGRFWRSLPGHEPRLNGPMYGEPESYPDQVVFFGGSFNPWHEGHRACIQLCPEQNHLIVIPDSNPWKEGVDQRCYWQEYQTLRNRLADTTVHVFPGFNGMERPNPTIGWLPYTDYQSKAMLIGDDNFASLPRWAQAGRLMRSLNRLYIAPRNAEPSKIEATFTWLAQEAPKIDVQFLDDHPFRDRSSTAIRNRLGTNL